MSKTAGLKRIKAKSNAAVYNNAQWDLIDLRDKEGEAALEKMDRKILPDSLKNKSTEEIKKIINEKATQRSFIQSEINTLNTKRDAFIAAEKLKNANKNQVATLESEIEKIIKTQVKQFKMNIQ